MLVRCAAKYGLQAAARIALLMARPIGSGFPVGAAALTNYGRVILGANKETHSDDAIHAEESLVGQLWLGEMLVRLAIVGRDGNLLTPCGGCRDFLVDYTAPGAEVLLLTKKGSRRWFPVADLLPNTYTVTRDLGDLSDASKDHQLFKIAREIMQTATYAPYTGKIHGAALFTVDNKVFAAARREDAAWHHDNAIEVLLSLLAMAGEGVIDRVLFIDEKAVAAPRFPNGRCLQKLYEEAQKGDNYFNVIAASTSGTLWYRTVDQLLPFAFGPRDLGLIRN